jgi:hypothetical protein
VGKLTFAIVHQPRVGSTHLAALLDSHPAIRCYGELFHTNGLVGAEQLWGVGFSASGYTNHHEFLAHSVDTAGAPIVGCKLAWSWFAHWPETLDLFHDRDLRVVRITRNLLEVVISDALVAESGIYHAAAATEVGFLAGVQDGPVDARTVRVDPQRCEHELQHRFFLDVLLDELARNCETFQIVHQSIPGQSDALLEWLGATPKVLSSPWLEIRTRPIPEVVENWDELAAHLSGTKWQALVGSVLDDRGGQS